MLMTFTALGAILCAFVAWQLLKAHRTIEDLLKTNERLTIENHLQAVEIKRKNAEVNNAKIKQKHTQDVSRASPRRVDEQLHAKGYFRDE